METVIGNCEYCDWLTTIFKNFGDEYKLGAGETQQSKF